MWKYKWKVDKALNFLVYKRIVAKPNDGFYRQLKEVEAKLNLPQDNANNNAMKVTQKNIKPMSPSFTKQSQVR
jgi:hypothetical protein